MNNTKYKPIMAHNFLDVMNRAMEDFVKDCIAKSFPFQMESPNLPYLMEIGKSVILTNIAEKGNINVFTIEFEINEKIRQTLSEKYA